jgi:uncharacterized protein (TIGR03790 family)
MILSLSIIGTVCAEGLDAARLGVIYNVDDAQSRRVALYYATERAIPSANLIGIHLPPLAVMAPDAFVAVRAQLLEALPTAVQSLLLVWSKPFAVGCMSITTAFAAGYDPAFCEPGCAHTRLNPLFDSAGWLPADTLGWWPAMLLPSDDERLAHDLIQRGIAADASAPAGTVYLVTTFDPKRNVRAATYANVKAGLFRRIATVQLSTPIWSDVADAIGYFTGTAHVDELSKIHFRPGALADHLTSFGGVLSGGTQMAALAWLQQGATASYGSVSEPCAFPEKFPAIDILFAHYSHGETALEAYWKSVDMPGQGLFIGEPLARPYAVRGR